MPDKEIQGTKPIPSVSDRLVSIETKAQELEAKIAALEVHLKASDTYIDKLVAHLNSTKSQSLMKGVSQFVQRSSYY